MLAHTRPDVPVLVCDDASPDARSQEHVWGLERSDASARADLAERELLYLRREHTAGFPANVNGAFICAAPADVVIINSDCLVAQGWLEGLREAAYCDATAATATALTNNGTLVSVPGWGPQPPRRQGSEPAGPSFEHAAAAVRARSLRARPRLLTAVGHCVYVRRSALELVGDFDLAFSPGYGEEVDFSQRCLHAGLCHVAADDVLVLHHGGGSFGRDGGPHPVQAEHERILALRYPYYHAAVAAAEEDATGPLARSLGAARRALQGLRVVIDARILVGPMTGTHLHVLELIAALARTGEARITAIVQPNLSAYARDLLATLAGVERVTIAPGSPGTPIGRADVFHRPFQVGSHADLMLAARLGERWIVTHQDLIAYHNPSYFRSFGAWEGYRRLTRTALSVADRVIFVSGHARDDALAEDLIEPGRASVAYNGTDHTLTRIDPVAVRPPGTARLPADGEMMLCLGTNFRHKNRLFALRLLEQLQRRHDWHGMLVFAGPGVTLGSSAATEKELLEADPRLAGAVLDLTAVSEAEKLWLLRRAALVLYPTVHEGFGLIPFEAADHGVPCLWAAGTSLSEILPDSAAGIVAWDPELSARRALALMRDERARASNLSSIRHAAKALRWESTARELLEIYHDTCDRPAAPAGALERRQGSMQGGVSDDAMRLIGPHGALPAGLERPLLALATHPGVGTPVFSAIKLGYRASYRLRRRKGVNGRLT